MAPEKTYHFLSPSGELVTITGIKRFCLERGYYPPALYAVALGRQEAAYGYTKPAGSAFVPGSEAVELGSHRKLPPRTSRKSAFDPGKREAVEPESDMTPWKTAVAEALAAFAVDVSYAVQMAKTARMIEAAAARGRARAVANRAR
jgi:hypothetical protein